MEEKPKPPDKMRSAIQLAGFHYIACMKAMPSNADHKLTIGKSEFFFENIRTADSTTLHWEFQRWATSAVLRDLIENFSIFLTETYSEIVTGTPHRLFSTSPTRFERSGIEDQLSVLQTEFSVAQEWISRLTGFNRARNCLAHRAGIVGSRDANDNGDLVIRWLAGKTTPADGSPKDVIEVHGPMAKFVRAEHIHGDFAAKIELLDRQKRVAVGSMLEFHPDEIFEICQTFQLASAAFSVMETSGVTASRGADATSAEI